MKSEKYYKDYIGTIPDFPKKGIMFRDITPTLENPEAFKCVIDDFAALAEQYNFNKIICADARGFIFGSALAYKLNKGLVLARKPGKLPSPGFSFGYELEYGSNTLVIPKDSINKSDKVLIVDDLLATGGSAGAMMELIKMSGATPAAAFFYIELPDLNGRAYMKKVNDLPIHSLVCFEGE